MLRISDVGAKQSRLSVAFLSVQQQPSRAGNEKGSELRDPNKIRAKNSI